MPDLVLCEFDNNLTESAMMWVDLDGERDRIYFQFPPKIVTDTNTSSWLEADVWSIEPLRIHSGSQGRRIGVEWEYIATDSVFTGKKIAENIRILKRYFFEFTREYYPVIWFKYSHIVPVETQFRLRDFASSFGPEIVKDGKDYYPLYAKVNVTLELATDNKVRDERELEAKVKEDPLRSVVLEWY